VKTYIIKPEFLELYGPDANPMTILTEDDVEMIARGWEKDEYDILQQLIELKPSGYRPIHRFAGHPSWVELNNLIREDSGCDEDFFATEDDYRLEVRSGFVKYDGYYTTVYIDD